MPRDLGVREPAPVAHRAEEERVGLLEHRLRIASRLQERSGRLARGFLLRALGNQLAERVLHVGRVAYEQIAELRVVDRGIESVEGDRDAAAVEVCEAVEQTGAVVVVGQGVAVVALDAGRVAELGVAILELRVAIFEPCIVGGPFAISTETGFLGDLLPGLSRWRALDNCGESVGSDSGTIAHLIRLRTFRR